MTLTFADEVDCSRGDVIAAAADPPEAADQFEATIVWMDEHELLPGPRLLAEARHADGHGDRPAARNMRSTSTRSSISRRQTLALNAIGVAEIATDREIVFEPYAVEGSSPNRVLGGFILIDKLTNATVACGMLHFALRRAHNIHRQHLDVSRETHATLKGQKPAVLWFTGLSRRGQVDHRQSRRDRSSSRAGGTPSCSTATMSATASTATSASPRPTGSRISAASARSRG